MEAVAIIGTVILLAILIFACIKQYNILATLLLLTFAGYGLATIVLGGTVLDKSKGFVFFDIFETFSTSITGTFTMMGFLVLVVMAYSDFMSKIKASDMFAGLLAIPLKKIPSKMIVLVLGSELCLLIHWVVPSGMGCFMVCMATIWPAMMAAGCNPVTAAIAVLLGANTASGPASSLNLMTLQLIGSTATAADAFVMYGIVLPLIVVPLASLFNYFWSLFCEKTGPVGECEFEEHDIKSLGVPIWYALFPLIPLLLVIIFSSMIMKTITISIVAAYALCWCVFFLIHVLRCKSGEKKNAYDEFGQAFWTDMGTRFGQVVSIVVMGTFFGQALAKIGGINLAVQYLTGSLGMGFLPLFVICFCLALIFGALGGCNMAIAVIVPVLAPTAAATGITGDALTALAVIFCFGAISYCLFAQPFDPKVLYISQMYKIDIMYTLKRTIPAGFCAAFLTLIIGLIMYHPIP